MDKSWVALADALTSDIDERPRATVLDLGTYMYGGSSGLVVRRMLV